MCCCRKVTVQRALERALDLVSQELLVWASKSGDTSGCTAVIAVALGGSFVVAHIGDSRAILCQQRSEEGVLRLVLPRVSSLLSDVESDTDEEESTCVLKVTSGAHEGPTRHALSETVTHQTALRKCRSPALLVSRVRACCGVDVRSQPRARG